MLPFEHPSCPALHTGADGGATPRFAAYGSTKRGLEQLSKSLRVRGQAGWQLRSRACACTALHALPLAPCAANPLADSRAVHSPPLQSELRSSGLKKIGVHK